MMHLNGIKDSKAFLFSLRSNNRLKEMMKFPIKEIEKAFEKFTDFLTIFAAVLTAAVVGVTIYLIGG